MAKTHAERQREYQQRHPQKEKEKRARYMAAERIFRERHRKDYEALFDYKVDPTKRARQAMRELKEQFPTDWKKTLDAQ